MAEVDPLVPSSSTPTSTDEEDWPAKASATVVQYVGTVRDKTTGPALRLSRNLVYFAAMGMIASVVLILALVMLVRLLVSATAYVPSVEEGETWLAYLILGVVFIGAGMFLWRKKEA